VTRKELVKRYNVAVDCAVAGGALFDVMRDLDKMGAFSSLETHERDAVYAALTPAYEIWKSRPDYRPLAEEPGAEWTDEVLDRLRARADDPYEKADDFPHDDFLECDTCRAKPGSPTLCRGCLRNRTMIGMLNTLLRKEQA
jgi:hypothetical protein